MPSSPMFRLDTVVPAAGMPQISLYDAAPLYPNADLAALQSAPNGFAQFDFGTRSVLSGPDSLYSQSSLHQVKPRPNAAAGLAGALTYADNFVQTAPVGTARGGIDTGFADDLTATYSVVYRHDPVGANVGAIIIGTADQPSTDNTTGWYIQRNPYSSSVTSLAVPGATGVGLALPAGTAVGDWICVTVAMDAAGFEIVMSGNASAISATRGAIAPRNLVLGNGYFNAGTYYDYPVALAEFVKVPGVKLTRAQMLADQADIRTRLAGRGIIVK